MTYYRLTYEMRFWLDRDKVLPPREEKYFQVGTLVVNDPADGFYRVVNEPRFGRRALTAQCLRALSPLEVLALEAT